MSTAPFAEQLAERAEAAGVVLDTRLSSALTVYFELLRRWNRRINLTGLDLDALTIDGVDRLFIEPLLAARHVAPGTASIIDLGSGGGSPAIPLTLAVPDASLTMIESRARKSVFLKEAARELGLSATVLTVRYEEALGFQDLRAAFDTMTCRALRLSSKDLAKVERLVRSGGHLLLFRSAHDRHELPVPTLTEVESQPLPRLGSELLVLRKL